MIRSMTGFAVRELDWDGKQLTIQIRSLNSKTSDIRLHLPEIFRRQEARILKTVQRFLPRGKVDVSVQFNDNKQAGLFTINREQLIHYYRELVDIYKSSGIAPFTSGMPETLLRLPGVVMEETEEPSAVQWEEFFRALQEVLKEVVDFQIEEGKSLYAEIKNGIENILDLLDSIVPFEENRIEKIKKRLLQKLDGISVDENRYEQEIIYYLDKLDIHEEKTRLRKHCEYFLEVLDEEESQGKKLTFIAQEILREINTLGAKAYDAGIQRIVVSMKSEQEKIRELLANVL